MMIPSSNTVVEPETARIVPADGSVSVHVSRLRVVQISADASSLQQFDVGRMLAAAELLADAKVDLILWNGTAASWLGFDWDRDLVQAVESHTGICTTTAIMAMNAALSRLGARRIGLVTPYVEGLEARIIRNYGDIGLGVVAAARRDLTENTDYAAITPDEIADMARKVARTPVDAILVLCTNLAGSSVTVQLGKELGVPILDSVRVAVEHSLALLAEGRTVDAGTPRA